MTMPRPMVQATILPTTAIAKRRTTSPLNKPASSSSKTAPRAATRIAKAANGGGGADAAADAVTVTAPAATARQPTREPTRERSRPAGRSEETFASAEELSAPTSAEPELSNAVADLDASPRPPRKPRVSAEAPAASPAAEAEPVRRRSTVRERAPVTSGDETAAVSTHQPRRLQPRRSPPPRTTTAKRQAISRAAPVGGRAVLPAVEKQCGATAVRGAP